MKKLKRLKELQYQIERLQKEIEEDTELRKKMDFLEKSPNNYVMFTHDYVAFCMYVRKTYGETLCGEVFCNDDHGNVRLNNYDQFSVDEIWDYSIITRDEALEYMRAKFEEGVCGMGNDR